MGEEQLGSWYEDIKRVTRPTLSKPTRKKRKSEKERRQGPGLTGSEGFSSG